MSHRKMKMNNETIIKLTDFNGLFCKPRQPFWKNERLKSVHTDEKAEVSNQNGRQ